MSATVFTADAASQASIELIKNGKGTQALHDVVVALRAARRSGTASVKTKATVSGSGKKPYRQKGTGRARAGYMSSPIRVGGGVVFGPHPRDYSKKTSKSVRRLAFRKALSGRILAGDVLVADAFAVGELKTKAFLKLLGEQISGDFKNVLIVAPQFDETTYKAARNVAKAQLVTASEVNSEQLLRYDKILITRDALAKFAERTGGVANSTAAE
ncbi:MAG: 50S ribosomal protein L4 [Verrucomicrobia bacterium]|nr:50S ribosomal protein L4 [Verrucomicrobiota bacterium]